MLATRQTLDIMAIRYGEDFAGSTEEATLGKPISMMMSPREQVMAYVMRRYPFFASTPAERRGLFHKDKAVMPLAAVSAA